MCLLFPDWQHQALPANAFVYNAKVYYENKAKNSYQKQAYFFLINISWRRILQKRGCKSRAFSKYLSPCKKVHCALMERTRGENHGYVNCPKMETQQTMKCTILLELASPFPPQLLLEIGPSRGNTLKWELLHLFLILLSIKQHCHLEEGKLC